MKKKKSLPTVWVVIICVCILGFAIAYFISPIDVVPDVYPVICHIDDILVALAGVVSSILIVVNKIKAVKSEEPVEVIDVEVDK